MMQITLLQDRKAAKEAELAKERSRIAAENSGPSLRDIEMDKINQQLRSEALAVKAVPSDGNCLYRAIEDQLRHGFQASTAEVAVSEEALAAAPAAVAAAVDHYALRCLAAEHIRRHAEEFCPFLGFEEGSSGFRDYCDRVASSTLAEWGGQLELKALATALGRTIVVYSADAPVLTMQPQDAAYVASTTSLSVGPPLRLSYHKHYYALGEHYNSVRSILDERMGELSVASPAVES